MKNTYTTPIDFWQERDFGAKISAVFEFLGAHWRRLGKCLLYFVLPGALLMGIGLGMFTNIIWGQMGTTMQRAQRGVRASPEAAAMFSKLSTYYGLGLVFVGGLLAFLLLLGTLYGYLRARLLLPATEPVTPAAVWQQMRSQLGRMVLAFVLFVGLFIGFMLIFMLIAFAFPPLFLLFGPGMVYFGTVLSLYLPVLWLEDVSVWGAIGRCFQLIKGKWWSTFGLLVVASLIQGVVGVVFAIPRYAVLAGKMLHLPGLESDVLGLVASTFYAIGLPFIYCIPLLAAAFQYFNLVERHEGYSLRLLVDELGQPAAAARSHHYQPDEEGEY